MFLQKTREFFLSQFSIGLITFVLRDDDCLDANDINEKTVIGRKREWISDEQNDGFEFDWNKECLMIATGHS